MSCILMHCLLMLVASAGLADRSGRREIPAGGCGTGKIPHEAGRNHHAARLWRALGEPAADWLSAPEFTLPLLTKNDGTVKTVSILATYTANGPSF